MLCLSFGRLSGEDDKTDPLMFAFAPRSLSRKSQVGVGFVVPSHDRPVGLRLLPLDHQGFLLRYGRFPFQARFKCSRGICSVD